MSKTIRLGYTDINNMGDQLNVIIVEKIFGYKVKKAKRYNCQCLGIGSSLGSMLWDDKIHIRFFQQMSRMLFDEVDIWSTGFLCEKLDNDSFFRNNVNFRALRGELSKKRVEKIINKKLDIPTGDGGLLAAQLFDKAFKKKYSIGIIPHMREKSDIYFKELYNNYENAIMIDLQDDPMSVLKTIAQCEVIISSSLHGLIVADSFGIPNKYIKVTNKPHGDGFKFRDYYSSFGLSIDQYDNNKDVNFSIDQIIADYKIDSSIVELKKKQLYECFPSL